MGINVITAHDCQRGFLSLGERAGLPSIGSAKEGVRASNLSAG